MHIIRLNSENFWRSWTSAWKRQKSWKSEVGWILGVFLGMFQTMIFLGSLGNGALDLKITKIIFRMNFRIFEITERLPNSSWLWFLRFPKKGLKSKMKNSRNAPYIWFCKNNFFDSTHGSVGSIDPENPRKCPGPNWPKNF